MATKSGSTRSLCRRLAARTAGVLALGALGWAVPAHALDLKLKLDPGVAIPLGAPQATYYGLGGGGQVSLGLGVTSFMDVQLASDMAFFPSKKGAPVAGTGAIYSAGGGLRFFLPESAGGRWQPWLDGNALYVRTGALDRFGFSAGAGLTIFVDKGHVFGLGPYLRYLQVVQTAVQGYDSTDGKVLLAGLSLQVRLWKAPPPPVKEPPKDRDGDGIVDEKDRCPDEPETVNGYEDEDGCPDNPDRDGDGIPNATDKCPDEPENQNGYQDEDGCPDNPDRDGDGIVNEHDQCPDQAEDKDGFEDEDGCPDLDNDGDGVLDVVDQCPNLAGPADNDGCPVKEEAKVTAKKIEISQKVYFEFDKDKVQPKSYPLLDVVAQALREHPDLRVRIEGHTDDKGTDEYNLSLSQRRAEAVRRYLVQRGHIAAERLEAQGYGKRRPLDTADTDEAREKNRRVEFVIVGGPEATPSPAESPAKQ